MPSATPARNDEAAAKRWLRSQLRWEATLAQLRAERDGGETQPATEPGKRRPAAA